MAFTGLFQSPEQIRATEYQKGISGLSGWKAFGYGLGDLFSEESAAEVEAREIQEISQQVEQSFGDEWQNMNMEQRFSAGVNAMTQAGKTNAAIKLMEELKKFSSERRAEEDAARKMRAEGMSAVEFAQKQEDRPHKVYRGFKKEERAAAAEDRAVKEFKTKEGERETKQAQAQLKKESKAWTTNYLNEIKPIGRSPSSEQLMEALDAMPEEYKFKGNPSFESLWTRSENKAKAEGREDEAGALELRKSYDILSNNLKTQEEQLTLYLEALEDRGWGNTSSATKMGTKLNQVINDRQTLEAEGRRSDRSLAAEETRARYATAVPIGKGAELISPVLLSKPPTGIDDIDAKILRESMGAKIESMDRTLKNERGLMEPGRAVDYYTKILSLPEVYNPGDKTMPMMGEGYSYNPSAFDKISSTAFGRAGFNISSENVDYYLEHNLLIPGVTRYKQKNGEVVIMTIEDILGLRMSKGIK